MRPVTPPRPEIVQHRPLKNGGLELSERWMIAFADVGETVLAGQRIPRPDEGELVACTFERADHRTPLDSVVERCPRIARRGVRRIDIRGTQDRGDRQRRLHVVRTAPVCRDFEPGSAQALDERCEIGPVAPRHDVGATKPIDNDVIHVGIRSGRPWIGEALDGATRAVAQRPGPCVECGGERDDDREDDADVAHDLKQLRLRRLVSGKCPRRGAAAREVGNAEQLVGVGHPSCQRAADDRKEAEEAESDGRGGAGPAERRRKPAHGQRRADGRGRHQQRSPQDARRCGQEDRSVAPERTEYREEGVGNGQQGVATRVSVGRARALLRRVGRRQVRPPVSAMRIR